MSKNGLVIEDNKNNREILAALLVQEGFAVTALEKPVGIEAYLKNLDHLDIVFLDLEMPGLNGYDVLKIIRDHPRFGRVPVVAYTVHVSELNQVKTQGFNAFLGKPLDIDRFPQYLEQILSRQSVWIVP
ncbi:MAG: hypothetical protein OHK0023_00990 [Anaerolineae bacterium]